MTFKIELERNIEAKGLLKTLDIKRLFGLVFVRSAGGLSCVIKIIM